MTGGNQLQSALACPESSEGLTVEETHMLSVSTAFVVTTPRLWRDVPHELSLHLQILCNFCGEKDSVSVYGGGTNKKRRILNFSFKP